LDAPTRGVAHVVEQSVDDVSTCAVEVCTEDKDALALMGGADFTRTEYACRCVITQAFQLAEDMEQNRCPCFVAPMVSAEL